MALEDRRHPDAERLAEYADGVLDAEARAAVEQHLADCAECRAIVMETMAFLDGNPAIAASTPPRVIPFATRRRVTAAAVGSMYNSLPPSCSPYAGSYYYCGGAYYAPRYEGSSVTYVVVDKPD